ncbi:hypothetical protein [Ruminococcus bovis]|uniref:Uncharacterized protein n=1 Tax=Ruminococcus bovis TaxID=2564099 RepID=A0A4P8XYY0_9FIRM|nr:hypothetical protein [Ruminococcus bovis]QCT07300.1 hypothetical protein E5Z56_07990 [Ruminococcus bovis]
MKKKEIIITVLSVLVVALAICVVVLAYNNHQLKSTNNPEKVSTAHKVKGVYFRKVYGSMGAIHGDGITNNKCTFKTEVYAFDSNVKFLNDISKLRFDNDNVYIEKVVVNDNPEKENDLTKYTVSFTVGFAKDGNYSVKELVYDDGNNTVKYPMGNIAFTYKMGQTVDLQQGIDTEITNNKIAYYFLENNKEPFTVEGLVSGESSDFTYTYKKNVKFTPGKQLDYYVDINGNATGADTTVFCPLFEIKIENSNQTKYFVPISQTYGGNNNLSYSQIKEYVQK